MGSAARVTSAAEGLPRRRFTVAEVEAMVAAGVIEEDERIELIGGELVPMSPKGNQHEVVKVALLDRWYRARPDEVLLAPETTFRLSEDTYLEPDVVVYPSALEPKDLTGPGVLLVVEIAELFATLRHGAQGEALCQLRRARTLGDRRGQVDGSRFSRPGADGYREARDFTAAERIAPLFRRRPSRCASTNSDVNRLARTKDGDTHENFRRPGHFGGRRSAAPAFYGGRSGGDGRGRRDGGG